MKVDDYNLSKLSNEAENFKEDCQNILNYGKYSAQVVNNTPPAWTARNGEFVFFASGTIKRLYFYNINAWDFIEYNAGGVGGQGTRIVTSDVAYGGNLLIIPELTFSMGVSETWTFELYASVSNGGTSNFSINAPGGSTLVVRYIGVASNGGLRKENINALNSTTTSSFFTTSSTANYLSVSGTVQTGASSAGALTFAGIDVVGSSVKAGSYIGYRKLV